MGVEIAAVNMDFLTSFTMEHMEELSGEYICVANVHTTVTASEDPEYMRIQNEAVMAIPDGGPLSSYGRKKGYSDMERTTGPSYMGKMLELSRDKGYRHFFYGSTQETLDKLRSVLETEYPGATVAGMYSPPFRALTEEEEAGVIKMINESDADIIWVGLCAPKQERWMYEHRGKVHGLMVGVGAAFDYHAGNISRAPEWMQRHNLEWLYRLLQDPGRLAGRYLRTNTKYLLWRIRN